MGVMVGGGGGGGLGQVLTKGMLGYDGAFSGAN